MQDTYGELWEFKEHLPQWSFGVNKFKSFVMLRIRIKGSTTFQIWNLNEKVSIIECVKTNYVVIVLRAVDDDGKDMEHQHSIVIDCRKDHARFDLKTSWNLSRGPNGNP